MAVARNFQQIKDYLMTTVLPKVMENVASHGEYVLQQSIQKHVYDYGTEHGRRYYADGTANPTGDLKRSVTSSLNKINNGMSVYIYHDTNQIISIPSRYIHGSPKWHIKNISKMMPELIEKGWSGLRFGNGWWRKPRPYFSMAKYYLSHHNSNFRTFKEDFIETFEYKFPNIKIKA